MKSFQQAWLHQQDTWTRSKPAAPAPSAENTFLLPEGVRATCSALGCDHIVKFWKRSARPVFEGQWACSRTCAETLVLAALNKQMAGASAFAAEATTHRHRIPIGLVLLDRGVITHFQLRQALDAQRAAGFGRIGHWLEQTCGVSPERIIQASAAQWNRPVLSTSGFMAESMALVMPAALRNESHMLPVRVAGGKILYLAFTDEVDVSTATAVERMCGLTVETGLLTQSDFASAEAALTFMDSIAYREEQIPNVAALCERIVDTLFREQPVASRIVPVRGGWWLRLWLERAALGKYGTLPATGEDVCDVIFRR